MQTPLWVLIIGVFIGPAVTATIANYLLGLQLAKYKESVDRRLTEYKASVDTAMSKEVEDYKASLERQLENHKKNLEMETARKIGYDRYLVDQQAALFKVYGNVFGKGPHRNLMNFETSSSEPSMRFWSRFISIKTRCRPSSRTRSFTYIIALRRPSRQTAALPRQRE